MTENLNCSYTRAGLRIWGKHLDARRVTARLQITPTESFSPGDPGGPHGIWHRGYWALDSRDSVASTNVQRHIEWLLDQLEPVHAEFMKLLAEDGIRADVGCYWESATGHGGPVFSAAFIQRFARFNLDLGITFFDPSSGDT